MNYPPGTIDPHHPDIVNLGLPTGATPIGIHLPGWWFADEPETEWAADYRYQGVGLLVGQTTFPGVSLQQPDGGALHVQLWRQRVRKIGNPLYIEALWRPGESALRVALHGIENRPSKDSIDAALRGRELLSPETPRGPKHGKGTNQSRPWPEIVKAWREVVDRAVYNGDEAHFQTLYDVLGMDHSSFYKRVKQGERDKLRAIERDMRADLTKRN
jgi:hypothetical protein